MGLSFRKRSGRIANGSRLIVPGQITTGEKVFEITFNGKQNPYDVPAPKEPTIPISPSRTPRPTPTPTPTPEQLVNPLITENNEYINVGENEYLEFVVSTPTI